MSDHDKPRSVIGAVNAALAIEREKAEATYADSAEVVTKWTVGMIIGKPPHVICEEVNAALAAERERGRNFTKQGLPLPVGYNRAMKSLDDCERCDVRRILTEQLAAERELRESEGGISSETRKQLAALRDENKTFRAAQKACEDCDGPTMAEVQQLREQLAAEQKMKWKLAEKLAAEKEKRECAEHNLRMYIEEKITIQDGLVATLMDALKGVRELMGTGGLDESYQIIDAALAKVGK